METFEVQLRELPLDKDHPDRKAAAHWWDSLGDERRVELMGTTMPFDSAFQELEVHAKLPNPGQYGWAAYDTDGNLVGYIIGLAKKGFPEEMSFDYQVDPDRQGIGIGPAMLREMLRDAQFSQFETFCCRVFPHNTQSVRVMEKVGFVLREDSDRDFWYTRQPS
ncbi:GNAT family N-acetyltransferase (plasmid) [Rhodococcus aetherivorans]|uniref:GNAT family N-acetyltransferase n=1 Tax=Rhodococcus aetherivorans TaxID=191292 RepID=A0AA46SGP4_9NOCA|nr:GNAT family N-acetyltransferase [Rhodococcus aetherivorans]UYF97172.1 GNAT family N-acetyltransferase [Rhodococcus aetherivorans]